MPLWFIHWDIKVKTDHKSVSDGSKGNAKFADNRARESTLCGTTKTESSIVHSLQAKATAA